MNKKENRELELDGDCLRKVAPINRVEKRDDVYKYRYTYSTIFVDDIDENIDIPTGVRLSIVDDGILEYQYNDEPRVIITEDGTFVDKDTQRKEGEQQAYFALSVLASEGYVGRFTKQ